MSEEQRSAQRIDLASPMDALLGEIPVRIIEMSLIGCKVEHAEKISMGARLYLKFSYEGSTFKLPARVARTEFRGGAGYVSGLELAKSLTESPQALVQLMESLAAKEREHAGSTFSFAPVPFMRQQDDNEEEDERVSRDEAEVQPDAEAQEELEREVDQPVPDLEPTRPAGPTFELDIGMELPIEVPPELQPPQQVVSTQTLELDLNPRFDADETTSLRPGKHFLECTNSGGQWSQRVTDSPKQPRDGFTIPIEEESEADLYYRTYEAADEDMRRMIRLSLELSIAGRKR